MATLERTIEIAAGAHAGQRDKLGEPYILHTLRVMLRLRTGELRIVGVLRDVMEDTPVTRESLRVEGFSADVVDALDALTKRDGGSYERFIDRAARHPIARVVKLADIADSLDSERLARLPAETAAAPIKKYTEAQSVIENKAEGGRHRGAGKVRAAYRTQLGGPGADRLKRPGSKKKSPEARSLLPDQYAESVVEEGDRYDLAFRTPPDAGPHHDDGTRASATRRSTERADNQRSFRPRSHRGQV